MSTVASTRVPMTVEDFLALPEDGIERDLIRGEVRERGRSVTRRNRRHSRTEARVAAHLVRWLDSQPGPRGEIVSGEAGFRLGGEPGNLVGIDVAYVSAELVAATPESAATFDGPPILAVEILPPSDKKEDIDEKVTLYLEAGVALVWLIDPRFRTVMVHRPGSEPELFNATQEISAEPHLPGFRVPVAALFGS